MSTTDLTSSTVDLSDDESFRDGFPHDFFSVLRREHPVFWHEPTPVTPDGEGFWVVSRYREVNEVFLHPEIYSSDRGGVREKGGTGIRDESGAGVWMNQTDDPDHHRLRALVNRGFSARAVAELEGEIRSRARDMLTSIVGRDSEFVTGFARELPSQVICMVLGVPPEDQQELLEVLDHGIEEYSESVLTPESMRHIRAYARQLIESKRANPDGGIMSTIVNAQLDDGSQLSDLQLIAFFSLLFPAGAETTRSSLAGGLLEFARQPDQYRRLVEDPSLIPTAVEEIVRWTTPSVYKRRTASADTELAGVRIRRGDKVTVWEMSANRDESVFDDPFRFDIGRSPNAHLGFGKGAHFCLGASLARQEIRLTLELLVAHVAEIRLAGEIEWMPNNRLFGLRRLPLHLVPKGVAS
jgi:cytochrome P450